MSIVIVLRVITKLTPAIKPTAIIKRTTIVMTTAIIKPMTIITPTAIINAVAGMRTPTRRLKAAIVGYIKEHRQTTESM